MSKEIGYYCLFNEGYVNPSQENKDFFGGSIKWLRTLDLRGKYIYDTTQHLTMEGFKTAGKSAILFPENSIAINKSGTYIGGLGILKSKMCANRAIIDIVPKDPELLEYIYYLLFYKRDEVNQKAVGRIQKNLYISALKTIKVTTDDRNEQIKIGKILSLIDSKIDINNRINDNLFY